jgi:hypothetical protein
MYGHSLFLLMNSEIPVYYKIAGLRPPRRSIVFWGDAFAAGCTVNLQPIGAVDSPFAASGRTPRKRARNLDPAGLPPGNGVNLRGGFR